MINGCILYANSSVLLLVIVIVSLISIFIDIPEDQIIDTAKASLDDDHSNSMNEKQNMVMSIKNRSSVVNNVNSNFAPIFDGKTLNGWEMAGDGRFVKVESDAALQSEGGMGLLWYSEKIYKNFTLKLEWKVSDESDNSGVFVRFPDPDNNPNNAVREGYEIQRDDKAADSIHQTGAIYDFAAPDKVVSNPPGQWNTMEIQTQDQSYTFIINGQKVTQFTGSRLNEGYIGLQAHDDKSKVSFRNIMIKEDNSE
jgi:hypothetical protein